MHQEGKSGHMFISVVLPVLNEGRFIGPVLEALAGQEYPSYKFEILVVDGGSSDETVSVVGNMSRVHPNIRLLENPKRLSGSGRNVGARAAKGDAVLFIDGHCEIPDPFLLAKLAELFGTTSADVICRPQPLDATGTDDVQKAIAVARASPLGHNPYSLIFSTAKDSFVMPDSSGAAYTRRVFEQIGYYDERLDACEDVDFNLRARKAGFRAYTSPKVTVRYFPRETFRSLFRQMARYGNGRARLFKKHPGDALSGAILLGAPLVLVVALAALAPFHRLALTLLLALVCAYLIVIAIGSFSLSRQARRNLAPSGGTAPVRGQAQAAGPVSRRNLAPVIFFSFLTIHLALLSGFWRGLMSSTRSAPGEDR